MATKIKILVFLVAIMVLISGCSTQDTHENKDNLLSNKTCFTQEDIDNAVASGVCLFIVDNDVYDMTNANTWTSAGHFEHVCGENISSNDPSLPRTHLRNRERYFSSKIGTMC